MAGAQRARTDTRSARTTASPPPVGPWTARRGIVLIEHVWAKPLRAAVTRADGIVVADSWLRPDDLVRLGEYMAGSDAPVRI